MAPEVFFTVCYRTSKPPAAIARRHVFRNAVLPGYTRHRVKHQEYPGILPDDAAGASVRGVLVGGLTAANQYHLDVFEGSEYVRQTVEVEVEVDETKTPENGAAESGETKTVAVQVYVFKHADGVERREWDFDEFRREKMHNWTRADYTFDGRLSSRVFLLSPVFKLTNLTFSPGCDPDDPATVAD